MSELTSEQKHMQKLALYILLGVVLTVTVLIVGSIYNHKQNVERDKYYADHCKGINEEPTSFGYKKECVQ